MTSAAIIVTILCCITVLVALGRYAGRGADNDTFFTAGRKTRWYVAALAMITAAMSGVTFVSVPGSVAADSFSYMQMVAGFTVGQMVVAFVLVPAFYRLRVVSLYEYLAGRFGTVSHRTGAWFFLLSKCTAAALKLYAVCAVLQLLVFDGCGLPFWVNVAVAVAAVWLYTVQGGVRSLIWTDVVKSLCLVAALVCTVVSLCRGMDLSFPDMCRMVAGSEESRVFFFDDPSSERYFWKMFAAGVVLLIAMTGLDQDMMQRNMSCPTVRDAQKNIVLTALCQIAVIAAFLVLGVLLYRYAEVRGLALPGKSDQMFSMVAVNGGLPEFVGVLFVVGLISTTCSSLGSSLTALTTSFTVDIMGAAQSGGEADVRRVRHRVHAAMAAVVGAMVLGFGYGADESVINLVFKVAGYTYGPILGLFAFGFLTRRRVRDAWVPAVSVAAPVLCAALQCVLAAGYGCHIGFELLIYNAAMVFIGLFLISLYYEE